MTDINSRDELVDVMAKAIAVDEGADCEPWITYQDPETKQMVPYWHSYKTQVRAAISALSAAGVVLVPEVATAKMKVAGEAILWSKIIEPVVHGSRQGTWETETADCYTAMLNASPFKEVK
jgi:hypothetical protein